MLSKRIEAILDINSKARMHMQLVKELLEEVEDLLRWRDASKEPPPKNGTIIVLDEGDGDYALVKWVESDKLVGGGAWFLGHGGPAAFIYDEDISTMRWRPFAT